MYDTFITGISHLFQGIKVAITDTWQLQLNRNLILLGHPGSHKSPVVSIATNYINNVCCHEDVGLNYKTILRNHYTPSQLLVSIEEAGSKVLIAQHELLTFLEICKVMDRKGQMDSTGQILLQFIEGQSSHMMYKSIKNVNIERILM